jgi:hypothetical protein
MSTYSTNYESALCSVFRISSSSTHAGWVHNRRGSVYYSYYASGFVGGSVYFPIMRQGSQWESSNCWGGRSIIPIMCQGSQRESWVRYIIPIEYLLFWIHKNYHVALSLNLRIGWIIGPDVFASDGSNPQFNLRVSVAVFLPDVGRLFIFFV